MQARQAQVARVQASRVPLWSKLFAAFICSSRVRGGQELAALPPTSAACAWMVVVDSSTTMLPSASKVIPGAVCTSGGPEGSRRSVPSLPLTLSCMQGTGLATDFADRHPPQAGMLQRATTSAAAGRKSTACGAAGRARRQAAGNHDWAGAGRSTRPGAKGGAHACPGQGPAEGGPVL